MIFKPLKSFSLVLLLLIYSNEIRAVNLSNGNQSLIENDYHYNSYYPLTFTRFYNSSTNIWSHNWKYALSYSNYSPVGPIISVTLPNSMSWSYKYNIANDLWEKTNNLDTNKLTYNSASGEFTFIMDGNNKVLFTPQLGQTFNEDNYWLTSKITLNHGEYLLTNDEHNDLNKVTSPNGNELVINQSHNIIGCSSNPVVTSIIGQSNLTTSYTYDNLCRLNKVIYPDNTFKTYEYQSSLNGIKDELNNYKENYSYSYYDRTGTTVNKKYKNNIPPIDILNFFYAANSTTITNGYKDNVVMYVGKQNDQTKPIGYSSFCSSCGGVQGSTITYNSHGYINSITDYKGNITQLHYNDNTNLLNQIKESVNNISLQRQTDIIYDNLWNLPLVITEPSGVMVNGSYNNRVTTNTYEQNTGVLIQKTISAPQSVSNTTPISRTWNYLYDSMNRLEEIQNPRFTSNLGNDKIYYTYNSTGQVDTIKNSLNQIYTLSNHDNYGQPQTITTTNGKNINVTYNLRGKIISVNQDGYTQSLTRNNAQLITQIITPSGSYKNLIYDNNQRLTQIEEYNENNVYQGKLMYTLDVMSNPITIEIFDSANLQIRLTTKQYTTKNMLYKDLTALNYATTYTYNANGNITNILDANNGNTLLIYDSLNRISSTTNPDNGIITYNYNPDDSIASVTAPTNQVTTYQYNGFGEIIKNISPDTGNTTINRNNIGDIINKTDARNITISYIYDDVGRPININYRK